MPNIKSAKKRVKVNAVKSEFNKAAKTNLKTVLKRADAAVVANADDAQAAITLAMKKVDQAAHKGLIHKNCAARKKSQLAIKLNTVKA
ncbi:MAG: 30S ribosomal protein S20 [Oscillospiraceae bacterium]